LYHEKQILAIAISDISDRMVRGEIWRFCQKWFWSLAERNGHKNAD